MTAILAYENLLEHADSTVTATSEATGYDVENCFDWLTHDYWQATAAGTNYVTVDLGSAKPVDYWAVFAHDLQDNAGGVRVQYSSDNFASDVNEYGGNLLTYSEQFDNVAWSKSSASVTANAANAPNGERTADRITDTSGAAEGHVPQAITVADDTSTHTFSVYLKAGTATEPLLYLAYTGGTTSATSWVFDLSAGTVTAYSAGAGSATITDVGGGWYRCAVTLANNGTGNTLLECRLQCEVWGLGGVGTGYFYAWGAQCEQASAASPYLPHPANGVIFYTGAEVSARYWRFRFSDSTTASKIGVCALGKRLDLPVGMPVGFTVPHHGRRFEYLPQISESGMFIGRSLKRQQYETEINLQYVTPAWARQNLQHFLAHADTKPFFFCWDDEVNTWEAAYCWLRDNVQPSYSKPTRMDVRLPIGCLV